MDRVKPKPELLTNSHGRCSVYFNFLHSTAKTPWTGGVADPHRFNADPHPSNADPDPAFHFHADPDRIQPFTFMRSEPGSCFSSKLWESATIVLQTLQGSILSLQTSIVGVHGPPRLYFEPLKFWILTLMRIRIQLFTCSNADSDHACTH